MPLPLIAATLGFVLATQGQPPALPGQRVPGGRNRAAATASADAEQAPVAPIIEVPTSVTHHSIDLPSGSINYTATAEQIPLKSDTGELECRMFAVSYTKDDVAAHSRPVTFAFNGGPGSATMWLHMGTLGPMRAPLNDDGTMPNPPFQAIDNKDTWLDFTDVVVIDAPGTGFSRLAKAELGSKYFGVQQDLNAFTTFIRNWLTIHKRWTSPLFIAGESYGGIRGSGLSDRLYQAGIALNGFVSISGTSNFLTLDGMRGNDATYISFFPSMSDVAWYHHKSGTGLSDVSSVFKAAQKWTDDVYAPALERGDSLSPSEKDHIAAQMSKFLGIDKKYCLESNLRVSEFQFFRQLLRDDYLTIGRYDGRLVGKEELGVGDRGSGDPSDDAITAPITSAFNDYPLSELWERVPVGGAARGLFGDGFGPAARAVSQSAL